MVERIDFRLKPRDATGRGLGVAVITQLMYARIRVHLGQQRLAPMRKQRVFKPDLAIADGLKTFI
jgi:hypothetical protein